MNPNLKLKSIISSKSAALKGTVEIPGDKSISHRALILGAMTIGETVISGVLKSSDVLKTAGAMEMLGVKIIVNPDNTWSIFGVGVGGFAEPDDVIDCGNSGTGIRLIMGAISTSPITATFTGDESLLKRPMARILQPLGLFGAQSLGRSNGLLPLTLKGACNPVPIKYFSPISSAQVKSAILLASLNAPGETVVIEPEKSRDHTERMLSAFGAKITIDKTETGNSISIQGQPELQPQKIFIPKDPSSAAFPICAALIVEGSSLFVPDVSQNPTRSGLITTLLEMGANISISNQRDFHGEPIADLEIKHSNLIGTEVPAKRVVSMIDEFPILSVVAAFAKGKTVMRGLKELRVKESDRIYTVARGLQKNGVEVEEGDDYLKVYGCNGRVPGGAKVETFFDHRVAMSFLCLGMASKKSVGIDDSASIETSFPNFLELMEGIGANFSPLLD